MFYCAIGEEDAIVWQDGEQTVDPETGDVVPINFTPTFVCVWDGLSPCYQIIYGELGVVPETTVDNVTIPAHPRVIPFAGWHILTQR